MGLAGSKREELKIVGDLPESITGRPFKLPKGADLQFGLPGFLKKGLRRYMTSLPSVDRERCVLCGICRDACPPKVITIKNSALSIDLGRCIRCWCCRELCPHDAMGIKRGGVLKLISGLKRIRKG
jgi:ferredoxin